MNSNARKYFFANVTTDGKRPVSTEAMAILKKIGGETDILAKSYCLPAGTSEPMPSAIRARFKTEPSVSPIVGLDHLNVPADNWVYNRGPMMNLLRGCRSRPNTKTPSAAF